MMLNLRILGRLLLVGAVLAIVGSSRVARAQDDDEPVDDDNAPAGECDGLAWSVIQQAPNFDQMEQWVFGRLGGSAGARNKLDSSLLVADR